MELAKLTFVYDDTVSYLHHVAVMFFNVWKIFCCRESILSQIIDQARHIVVRKRSVLVQWITIFVMLPCSCIAAVVLVPLCLNLICFTAFTCMFYSMP